jgi:hypothetical protein
MRNPNNLIFELREFMLNKVFVYSKKKNDARFLAVTLQKMFSKTWQNSELINFDLSDRMVKNIEAIQDQSLSTVSYQVVKNDLFFHFIPKHLIIYRDYGKFDLYNYLRIHFISFVEGCPLIYIPPFKPVSSYWTKIIRGVFHGREGVTNLSKGN